MTVMYLTPEKQSYRTPDLTIAGAYSPGIEILDMKLGGDGNVLLRDELNDAFQTWKKPYNDFADVNPRKPFRYASEPTGELYPADKSVMDVGLGPGRIGKAFSLIDQVRYDAKEAMINEDGQTLMNIVETENMDKIDRVAVFSSQKNLAHIAKYRNGQTELGRNVNYFDMIVQEAIAEGIDEKGLMDYIEERTSNTMLHEFLHTVGRKPGAVTEEKRVRQILLDMYRNKQKKGSETTKTKYKRLADRMESELKNVEAAYGSAYSTLRGYMSAEEAESLLEELVAEAEASGEDVGDYLAERVEEIAEEASQKESNPDEVEEESAESSDKAEETDSGEAED